jgi:hypothetical protein
MNQDEIKQLAIDHGLIVIAQNSPASGPWFKYDWSYFNIEAYTKAVEEKKNEDVDTLVKALDKAAYALFQIKRMAPHDILSLAIKEHVDACEVLNKFKVPE